MNAHLNRAANLMILELSVLSLCMLMRDSFSLLLPEETFLWLALLCGLLWIAETFRYGAFVGLPMSALALWYVYSQRSLDLIAEGRDMLNRISAVYYGHYSSVAVAAQDSMAGDHMVITLLVFFVLGAFIAAALSSGSFRVSLVVLATVPLFALCIAVNGTPKVLPVVGFLLALSGLQIGGDVFRLSDGAGKAFFLGLLPCLVVLGGLLLLYNPERYEPTERDISLAQRFDKLGNALAGWISEDSEAQETAGNTFIPTAKPSAGKAPNGWNDGSDDLDLTAEFDTSALDDEAFRVTADMEGSLYFRGRSYGDYTGQAWSAAVENTHANALSYAAQALAPMDETRAGEFQLRSPMVYDVLYLPYYSIAASTGDVMVPSEDYQSYTGTFYVSAAGSDALAGAAVFSDQLGAEELQYREYAHAYYTRLPESTRSALTQICSANGWTAETEGILWRVAEFVRGQGVYDVNVAPYPSDDYAVWFLTEAHTGYCIHFATAAVALYRSLGIPARVCEGYLVNNLNPGHALRVTGADAHAWAEVYVDHLGWVPIEVTASAADGSYQPAEGNIAPTPEPSDPGAENGAEPTPQPQNEGEAEEPRSEKETSDGGGNNEQEDASSGSDAARTGAGSDSVMSPVWRVILTVTAVLAGLTGLIGGRYAILRKLIRNRLKDADGNRRAVNIYRQAERVLRYGGEMPAELQATAEKARFSQHEISEDELGHCAQLLQELTEGTADSLGRWKRLQFRFLSGNM